MNIRITALLALILIILAGFYYIYDVRISGKKEEKKAKDEKIFSFDRKDLLSIKIKKGNETIEIQKSDDGFRIASPEKTLASFTLIDGIITMLNDLKKEKTIEEKPSDLTMFELNPPKIELQIEAKQDDKNIVAQLLIGSKTPSGSSYYVKLPGKPEVFTIPSVISAELEKTWKDFQEKEALPLDPSKVRSLTVEYGNKVFSLENPLNFWKSLGNESLWKITLPVSAKADKTKISNYLWDIKNIKTEKFLDDKEFLASKFNPEKFTARITVKQTGRPEETLIIGREKNKSFVSVRERSGERFMLKEQDVKKFLDKKYVDFQDKHILTLIPRDVKEIELRTGNTHIAAERTNENWKVKDPQGIKKLIPTLDSLLYKIESSEYVEKIDSGKNASVFESPEITITLRGEKGKKIATLIMVKKDPAGYFLREQLSSNDQYVVNNDIATLVDSIQKEINPTSPSIIVPSQKQDLSIPVNTVPGGSDKNVSTPHETLKNGSPQVKTFNASGNQQEEEKVKIVKKSVSAPVPLHSKANEKNEVKKTKKNTGAKIAKPAQVRTETVISPDTFKKETRTSESPAAPQSSPAGNIISPSPAP